MSKKRTPPFSVSEIMNVLVFRFSTKKVFPGPNSIGFVWGGVDERFCSLCSCYHGCESFLLCRRFWQS